MAPTSVKVFGSPTSPEVARVLMCLFEKDVEFQLIRVDAYRGPNRMPQYLKLQPRGEALTFEDDSLTLSESRGILRHISHKYAKQGNPDLIGSGALERASIEQWLQTEAQSFDVPSAEMVYSLAFLPPAMPQQHQNGNGNDNGDGNGMSNGNGIGIVTGNGVVNASTKRVAAGTPPGTTKEKEEEMRRLFEKSQRELEKLLDIYEQRLEEAAYLAGDKFTIADLSHLPNADRLASDPRSRRMFQRRRNVSRWWNAVSSRESWAYVKSLQRPPSSVDADADAAQNQEQPRSGEARDGNNNSSRQPSLSPSCDNPLLQDKHIGLQVFGQPAATNVARVLTCLFEKNLEFELVRIDTFKGPGHKLPEFIKLRDPTGQVTLKHGDKTLVDSRAICRYLCTQFPEEGNCAIYGTRSLERASIAQWLQTEAQSFDAPSSELVFHLVFAPHLNMLPDKAHIAVKERNLEKMLGVYNEILAENQYLTGDKFTLADLSHLPSTHYIAGTPRGRKLFTSKRHVARWYDAISNRPSWQQVVKMQSEHPGTFE